MEFDFDGVNWVVYKPKPSDNYILGYRGHSFMEAITPDHIYCPYIPSISSQSLQP
jgi:hypothetical protein